VYRCNDVHYDLTIVNLLGNIMTEYKTLKLALATLRQNAMAGDLSGFATLDELILNIRATERRMFQIVAAA